MDRLRIWWHRTVRNHVIEERRAPLTSLPYYDFVATRCWEDGCALMFMRVEKNEERSKAFWHMALAEMEALAMSEAGRER